MTEKREIKSYAWERDPHDWYIEPPCAATALLRVERFIGPTLDPCCGGGNIVKECLKAGVDAHGMDLIDRLGFCPDWWRGTQDFLSADQHLGQAGFMNIIMNPPFFHGKGTENFIRHALKRVDGKVAAFVDTRFLSGDKRAAGLFAEHRPSRIWILTPRVSCPPGQYLAAGNKAGGGSADWCWIVWDENRRSNTTETNWLRVNE